MSIEILPTEKISGKGVHGAGGACVFTLLTPSVSHRNCLITYEPSIIYMTTEGENLAFLSIDHCEYRNLYMTF